MKKLLLLLAYIYLCGTCDAQTFQKVYGDSINDKGTLFLPSAASGFYLLTIGQHYSAQPQYSVLKTNQYGDSLSSIIIPNSHSQNEGYCINCTDKFVIASSNFTMDSAFHYLDTLYIYKADTLGNIISTWTYPDTLSLTYSRILHTSDNGYLFAAGSWNYPVPAYMLFMKLDSVGNIQWKENVLPYSSSYETPIDLMETSDHYYIAEISQASGSNWTGPKQMMKLDTAGNILWTTLLTYGYTAGRYQQMLTTDSGYIYIDNTGYSMSSINNSRISMVDTGGTLRWSKVCFNSGVGYSNIQFNNTGGFYLCGEIYMQFGNWDIIYTVLDNSADSLSSFTFGLDSVNEQPYFFKQLNDGRLAVVGLYNPYPYNSSLNNNIYFAVSDTLGNVSAGFSNDFSRNKNEIIIYPNPSTGQFTIQELPPEIVSIEIYNPLGAKVFSEQISTTHKTINTNLPQGIYFVSVSDGERNVVRKLIVE